VSVISVIIDFLIGYASSFPKSRVSIFLLLVVIHWLLCALMLHLFLLSVPGGDFLNVLFSIVPLSFLGIIIICGRMWYEFLILTGQQSADEMLPLPHSPVVLILVLVFLMLLKWFRKINTLKGFVLSEICLILISSAMLISLLGLAM
jgi:hypothetical protein